MASTPSVWINRTGVPIKFYDRLGKVVTVLEPDLVSATTREGRVEHDAAFIDGDLVPLVHRFRGEVLDLPEPVEGTGLIVSGDVARAVGMGRSDLWQPFDLLPDMGDGAIGCRGLSRDLPGVRE